MSKSGNAANYNEINIVTTERAYKITGIKCFH